MNYGITIEYTEKDITKLVASAKDSILNYHVNSDPDALSNALMELIRIVEVTQLNSVEVIPAKKD